MHGESKGNAIGDTDTWYVEELNRDREMCYNKVGELLEQITSHKYIRTFWPHRPSPAEILRNVLPMTL